jgi:HD superfamily phosphohydrolase
MPHSKHIFCSLHGYIPVTNLALKIIDTPVFQRLRRIHQLGVAVYVFPNASHSRFEHSIGVYKLALDVIKHLKLKYPHLINPTFEKCLTTASLIHDLGHLFFSHVADLFIEQTPMLKESLKTHEERSIKIFKQLIVDFDLPFNLFEQTLIENMINPSKYFKHSIPWQFSILSNQYGFDIDRADYILRDSRNTGITVYTSVHDIQHIIKSMYINNNNIAYQNTQHLIQNLIESRTYLHKCVYQHRVSTAIEEMLFDIINQTSDIPWNNIEQLDDSFIYRYSNEKDTEANHLRYRIMIRDLYYVLDIDFNEQQKKYITTYILNTNIDDNIYIVRPLRKIGFGTTAFYRVSFILKNFTPTVQEKFKKAVKEWEYSMKPCFVRLKFI